MRNFFYSVCALMLGAISLIAVATEAAPLSIVYQGSLKQSGALVNGTYPMIFNITNADGSQTYWTSGSQSVAIKEGLYRMELSPTGFDWSAVDPYIETRVNGTLLLPREKISTTPYALVAKDLAPGASAKGKFQINRVGNGVGKLHVNGGNQTRDAVVEFARDFDNATAAARGGAIDFLPAVDADPQGNIISVGYWGSSSNQGTLTLNAYAQSNQLSLNQNGFVGIGKVPQARLHVYDTNPVLLVEQNPLAPGGAGIQLTAAGTSSSANAAYVQFHGGGSIWGQTAGNVLYFGPTNRSVNWMTVSPSGVFSPNGFMQSSSSKLKRDIREIAFDSKGSVLRPLKSSDIVLPKFKTLSGAAEKESIVAVPNQPETFDVPRAVIYKWKNPTNTNAPDADFISFMGDDLPVEAHALRNDGSRDPEAFYTGAVVGLLCAKVRAQDEVIKNLTARLDALEAKGK